MLDDVVLQDTTDSFTTEPGQYPITEQLLKAVYSKHWLPELLIDWMVFNAQLSSISAILYPLIYWKTEVLH